MTTFQRVSLLGQVLRPLLQDTRLLEIVVVVDGCDDGSIEVLRRLAGNDSRLRPIWTENRGMVGARVLGAQHARGDLLLFVDDDVELEPTAVAIHAAAHRDRRDLVVVGAMPVTDATHRTAEDYPRVIYAREYLRHTDSWLDKPDSVLPSLWEGNLSIAREAFLALDPPWPPEIGRAYHCDVDFGLRCAAAGLRGRYEPSARGVHHFSRSPSQFLGDARSSARGLLLVHAAHPEALGAFDQRQLTLGFPPLAGGMASMAANRSRLRLLIRRTVALLGHLRLFRLQRLAAHTLRASVQLNEIRRREAITSADKLAAVS